MGTKADENYFLLPVTSQRAREPRISDGPIISVEYNC